MVSVELQNPEIILTPITDREKEQLENEFMGDEHLYVLYRLAHSEQIHIGMMSTSTRCYYPAIANVKNLKKATSMAFFYNGGSQLERNVSCIMDRPVYRVQPTDDRTVALYDVMNGTIDNELDISLEDVVDGNYTLKTETPFVFRKLK